MGTTVRFSVLVLAVMLFVPLHAAGAPSSAESASMRALVAERIAQEGLDPEMFFAAPLEMEVIAADGTASTVTAPLGELLDRFDAPMRGGFAGGPHVTAGDMLHAYVNIRAGNALGYQVTQSALAPATPAVVLPPPATVLLFEAGGPVKNVRGSYLIGFHSVGTAIGSNVDTDASGPYLPVVSGGFVLDTRIDFVGHAAVAQGQVCFFGLCIATGGLLGDGVSDWSGQVPVPTVP